MVILVSFLAEAHCMDSLATSFLIQNAVRVGSDLSDLPQVEPVIAADPINPRHLVAASIVVREPNSDAWADSWTVHVLVSSDGGARWTRRYLPQLGVDVLAGDPCLSWVNHDALYLSCIAVRIAQSGKRETHVVVYRSEDGGFHWAGPLDVYPLGGFYDHPVMAARDSSLFVFATGPTDGAISIARTSMNTSVFKQLPVFHPDSLNNNLGGAAILSDSSVLFSYYTMSASLPTPLFAIRSTNRAASFEVSIVTPKHIPVGFPAVAVDRWSRQFRHRVYCTFVRSEQQPDVMVTSSDDGGATWSAPSVVQADMSITLRARPCLAVNSEGVVAISWVDGRHHGSGLCWDVYVAISLDGGKSFLPERRLTVETTCPNVPRNGGAGQRWRWGGDYSGICADADGNFQVVWSDTRTGIYQVWLSKITLDWWQH